MNKKRLFKFIVVFLMALIMVSCNNNQEPIKDKVKITFNIDGGSPTLGVIEIFKNEKVSKPTDPTKEGFDFSGWYFEGDLFDFDTVVKNNITLVAHWQETKPSNGEKALKRVMFKDNKTTYELDLDTFRLSDLKLELTYEDDSKEFVEVDVKMLKESDFRKLFTTGQYFIEINYEDRKLEALIIMSSSKSQFQLPNVLVYYLIRLENDKIIYDIYTNGLSNFYSFNLGLNHNFNKNDITINQEIEGVLSSNIKDDYLEIVYSSGKPVNGKQHLASIIVDNVSDLKEIIFNNEKTIFLDLVSDEVIEIKDLRLYIR